MVLFGLALLYVGPTATADLVNPSFEDDDASGGDVSGATGWFRFNDAFTTAGGPSAFDGLQTMKIFGPFFNGGGAGIGQALTASAGQNWTASAQAQNWSGDAIGENNFGLVQLQFLDSGNNVISSFDSGQVNSLTTQDVWNSLSISATAPTGTASAQIILLHVQLDPVTGGAVFFDSASLSSAIPEPGSFGLAGLGLIGLISTRRRRR
jgi:hypothetical protein